LLGVVEPAAAAVRAPLVRVVVVKDTGYVAAVIAVGADVVGEILVVVAIVAAAAAAAAAAASVSTAVAAVVVAGEPLGEQHCLPKEGVVVRIARLREPVLSAEADKASPI
jgi:hypothetical protein